MVADQFLCLAVIQFPPNFFIDLAVRQHPVYIVKQIQENFILCFGEWNFLLVAENLPLTRMNFKTEKRWYCFFNQFYFSISE